MPRVLTENEKQLMGFTYLSEFEQVINSLLLTNRQREIAELYYKEGMRQIDIAYKLNINEKTVGEEIRRISLKLAKYAF